MAHIEDQWFNGKTGEQTARNGQGRRWLLRYRDPDGTNRKLSFTRKSDAQATRKELEADIQRGTYVDPNAGQQTFDEYAALRSSHDTTDPNTRKRRDSSLRNHVTDSPLGKTPLNSIRPSTIQAWLSSLATLEESTAHTVYRIVSKDLEAAVNDGLITRNPCRATSVRKPRPANIRQEVWSTERVAAMRNAIDPRYRPTIDLGAGLGLRPGEIYALSIHDIDWFRGTVMIRRQVKIVENRLVFALPKGGKERHMPVSRELLSQLSDYLRRYPPHEVTLPWTKRTGQPETATLIISNYNDRAVNPSNAIPRIWHPALQRADIPQHRANGQHALRHFYVSHALTAGENPVSVAQWTGHASVGYMLQVYGHPMTHTEDQSRERVDALFRSFGDSSCATHAPQRRS